MHPVAFALLPDFSALLPALADAGLKSFVLLAFAGLAATALRHRSAAARHLVWSSALSGTLLLPILSLALPQWRVSFLPSWPDAPAAQLQAPGYSNGTTVSAVASEPVGQVADLAPKTQTPSSPSWATVSKPKSPEAAAPTSVPPSLPAWLALAWLSGTVFTLIPLVAGWWQIARITRRATPVTDAATQALLGELRAQFGLRRAVALHQTPAVAMPATWGAWSPVLLLPAAAADWSPTRRRLVLLHELGHISRWDWPAQLAAHAACALHWFNPLVWLAARRLRLEREQACDDLVLAAGAAPCDYADELLQITSALRGSRWLALASVPMAHRSSLELRLRSILDGTRRRAMLTRAAVLSALAALALVVVPLAMLRAANNPPGVPAPPLPAAGKSDASFVARLPGGGSVELLAVAYHPSADRPWWTPDGLPTNKYSFRTNQRWAGGDVTYYELYFRATNLPADATWVVGADSAEGFSGGTDNTKPLTPDEKPAPAEIKLITVYAPESVEFVDFKLYVASAAWETVDSMVLPRSTDDFNIGHSSIGKQVLQLVMFTPEENGSRESGTKIEVVHNLNMELRPDWDVRLIAINKAGREYPSSVYSGKSVSGSLTVKTYFFRDLPLAQIKEIRFQVRPFQALEFHHVALKPKLPHAAPVTSSAPFGAVIERDLPYVVSTDETREHGTYLDLKSDAIVSQAPPGGIALVGKTWRDARQGVGLTAVYVRPERWDATPGEVLGQLAQATPQPDTTLYSLPAPQTYFFRTSDGTAGTLQLLAVPGTENDHVRIRYKLLQPASGRDSP